jgi:transposase
MLRMDQVHVIRHKVLLEGKSVRSVAREMGISRNTVAKYLKNPEPRRRAARKQKHAPVREMVAPRIEEILLEWRERTTPKQRITGTRIHKQLLEEGYEVGITTVRDYLREFPLFFLRGIAWRWDLGYGASVSSIGNVVAGMRICVGCEMCRPVVRRRNA